MSLIAVAADRDPPATPAKLADGAHQATLERAFGRIFAVFMALHPPAEGHPVLLVLHVRSRHRDHAALRRAAAECGALISDLDDHELLIRLEPAR